MSYNKQFYGVSSTRHFRGTSSAGLRISSIVLLILTSFMNIILFLFEFLHKILCYLRDKLETVTLGTSGHGYQKTGRGPPPGLKGKQIETAGELLSLNTDIERRITSLINCETTSCSFVNKLNSSSSHEAIDEKFENMYTHINDSQFKKKFLNIVNGNIQENLNTSLFLDSKLERNNTLDQQLYNDYSRMLKSQRYKKMLKFRTKLPAYERRQEILDFVKENQVILISGETGCGKTTQVPQFILDDQIINKNGSRTKIICTQPRRISAISVATRVAAERGESLGNAVGYQIRLERVLSRQQGSIMFCTTGMLLQFMQGDPGLTDFSHIILDEIHERGTDSDFLIAILKQIIPKRPELKVILMSATLNSEKFSKYYDNCPSLHIPGYTFPVEEFYLEDVLLFTGFRFNGEANRFDVRNDDGKILNKRKFQEKINDNYSELMDSYLRDLQLQNKYPQFVINELRNRKYEELSLVLIEQLVSYICTTKGPGAILIFLPGMMDITKLHRILQESGRYPKGKYVIYPLHSRMPTVDQNVIFEVPEHGMRKIIIATSIAETSITIEDVVYVIDSGKMKLLRFDVENNIETLLPEWVTIANAQQRRGRAGRVQPGICYHMFSRVRESTFDRFPLPEMLRSRLEEVILRIKILQLGEASNFLKCVMDPPDSKPIEMGIDLLRKLNALDVNECLTPLGYHLAQLPLDPRTGKMIIWGALFSCIDPVLAIAASLSFKDPFYCPLNREDEAREKKLELGMDQFSDHLVLAEALKRFEENYERDKYLAGSFCREYFLSWNTLRLLSDMKDQFSRYLYEMKFLKNDNSKDINANRNSNNLSLIKAILCAGLYPNIAIVNGFTRGRLRLFTPEDGKVIIHPASINNKIQFAPSPYLIYFLKKRSTAIYLHDTTFVSPWALLFSNPNSFSQEWDGRCVITLSNSLNFYCRPTTANIIQKLREKLETLLKQKINYPGIIEWSGQEGRIITAITELMTQGEEDMGLESGKDYFA